MNTKELISTIWSKKSMLCVGLDTAAEKLPHGFSKDAKGMLAFNKEIIEATKDIAVSYKLNTAFYEALGVDGWKLMEETRALLPDHTFNIADAKRGDIGNTSKMYAKAFFDTLDFDALTVAPYMGEDSVAPFLEFKDKVTIVLGLTSNKGSIDFQTNASYSPPLYETVLRTVSQWGDSSSLMFVIGATKANMLEHIRKIIPDHFLLIPGVGAQGGNIGEVIKANSDGPAIINVSRGIIYASNENDYLEKIREKAIYYRDAFRG